MFSEGPRDSLPLHTNHHLPKSPAEPCENESEGSEGEKISLSKAGLQQRVTVNGCSVVELGDLMWQYPGLEGLLDPGNKAHLFPVELELHGTLLVLCTLAEQSRTRPVLVDKQE